MSTYPVRCDDSLKNDFIEAANKHGKDGAEVIRDFMDAYANGSTDPSLQANLNRVESRIAKLEEERSDLRDELDELDEKLSSLRDEREDIITELEVQENDESSRDEFFDSQISEIVRAIKRDELESVDAQIAFDNLNNKYDISREDAISMAEDRINGGDE